MRTRPSFLYRKPSPYPADFYQTNIRTVVLCGSGQWTVGMSIVLRRGTDCALGGLADTAGAHNRRAVVCWVRAAVQQCRLDSPRKCMVYLSSDSSQVVAWNRQPVSALVR